ncbi:zinc finger, CCHC-type containing protein [Tanacetum coccineum]
MASNFAKLDKFKGVDFRRWHKKMHFLLSSMSVTYVLTTPIPEDGENTTMEHIRKRNKWENDDYVCRGLILNDMSDPLFDIYQNVESFKELWESLDAKYMADDALSKKFLLSNFTNYKMTDSRPAMEQYNELLGILAFMSTSKLNDSIIWHARLGHVHFKRMQDMSNNGLILAFDTDIENDLCDLHDTLLLGNKKYFVTFIDDASRFCYVYLLHTKDDALDKFKVFKTKIELQQGALIKRFRIDMGVPRPSHRSLVNETEDIGGSMVPEDEEVTDEGFRQKSWIDYFDTYDPAARISIVRLLIALASILNLIIHQMDVKTTFLKFDESSKGVIICLYVDDMLIFGTNQVHIDLTKKLLSSRFSMKDIGEANVILGIRIKHVSNEIEISQSHYIEKVLKKFNYFDCTLVSTPMDTSEKPMPNDSQYVSQLEYSRVIACLMYAMTCTRCNFLGIQEANLHHQFNKESEFVALETASKEAEWMRNLIPEIPLSSKPIAPISIRCDSVSTLAKAYSQMYNGKYRHVGVMHSMIRELIMNGVVFIDLVRSQQNLADHLTKGLARDLVINTAKGMGLNSNLVAEC